MQEQGQEIENHTRPGRAKVSAYFLSVDFLSFFLLLFSFIPLMSSVRSLFFLSCTNSWIQHLFPFSRPFTPIVRSERDRLSVPLLFFPTNVFCTLCSLRTSSTLFFSYCLGVTHITHILNRVPFFFFSASFCVPPQLLPSFFFVFCFFFHPCHRHVVC
ncbi:hypothetical protein BKA57DRAFT_14558 [Linnemannia elongata]|nr:hypothetical protein BKA57DRAFT_14558 [Linnemannia elongata]